MPRDEILRKTKAVAQVLEALRNEHRQTLTNLQSTGAVTDTPSPPPPTSSSDGRVTMLTKSLEQLDLGISEAQVSVCSFLIYSGRRFHSF